MKRTILLLALLSTILCGAQIKHGVEKFGGIILDTLTTTQLNALPGIAKVKGAYYHDITKGKLVTWDGSDWVDDSTDNVTLTGIQDIPGRKTFSNPVTYFHGNAYFLAGSGPLISYPGYSFVHFDANGNLRVVSSTGLSSRYILDGSAITAERTYTLPDKPGTFALLDDIVPNNSLSEADQTIPDGVNRVVNTLNAGNISYQQDGTEIMKVGGNNDLAVQVSGLESTGAAFIDLFSPYRLPAIDVSVADPSAYAGVVVRSDDSNDDMYYSNGTEWINLSVVIDQVTSPEITAGSETALRAYSPADLVSFINTHGTQEYGLTWNPQTTDYEGVLTDVDGKVILFSNSTVATLTLNSTTGYPDGSIINILASDADVEIAYSGGYTGELFSTDVANGVRNLSLALNGGTWHSLTNNYSTYSGALYNLADAADPNNEANNSTNWSVVNGNLSISTTSVGADVQNGAFAIRIDQDGPDDPGTSWVARLDVSSVLSPSTSYNIVFYLKRGTGSTGNWSVGLDTTTGGWSTETQDSGLITSSAGNSYVQYTVIGTTDSGSTHYVDFQFNSNSDDADIMLIDNISITEN